MLNMIQGQKLFVVILVLAFILIGIFIYLFIQDRKISKLEKEVKEHHHREDKK